LPKRLPRNRKGCRENRQGQAIPLGGQDKFGIMPGALGGDASYGAKLLSLFPRNPDRGLSSDSGIMLVFDRRTGLNRSELTPTRLLPAAWTSSRRPRG
jgi:ornithine cyclodeaminase/alanine dehydrogenase-like protein (mu-crystallin family)